jgi:hypothetical protein
MRRFWDWLFPHQHEYCWDMFKQNFRCRCGDVISGDDLFPPDTMMGRYWRDRGAYDLNKWELIPRSCDEG